ncbi:hypothetical protein [Sphingomonas quercus]|uniref:Uncharacterized protein n=1 Tax=Sphingomonas quercus TaxID=2842451 RepID=A0ABS6BGU0_9SPHN|nr:hypothetical protein [Sphingomonas quercus]MBU3077513.1 hypothetical protein [Sphingomonas quercus]
MTATTLTVLARSYLHAEDIIHIEARKIGLPIDAKCTMSRTLPSGHTEYSVEIRAERPEDLAYLRRYCPQI